MVFAHVTDAYGEISGNNALLRIGSTAWFYIDVSKSCYCSSLSKILQNRPSAPVSQQGDWRGLVLTDDFGAVPLAPGLIAEKDVVKADSHCDAKAKMSIKEPKLLSVLSAWVEMGCKRC